MEVALERHLPEAGEEAVAHQGNIGRPSGILREYPLFGTDAVEQGCPPRHHQQRCAEIPMWITIKSTETTKGGPPKVSWEVGKTLFLVKVY